ncbi:tubulin-specific chaperone D-like [Corticium candelabrum]|uniref:tubulin-specific chaperone D-like n=1 Tax=Corticium candelabrum TaxID=121492 RepID=UPI002E3702CB|nr:tubulin-specific chaperone D-like [Corticium candelabrum]
MGRDVNSHPVLMHQAFKYLYIVTKVRGYKFILRLFPHEVTDLEPVLSLLQQQDDSDCQTWETRYMLLLWLSLLAMVPFDMVRFDGSGTDGRCQRAPVVDRMLELAKRYLQVTDKSRDAAALLLAKFVTRPDMSRRRLPEVLNWLLHILMNSDCQTMSGMVAMHGSLMSMSAMFKHGRREDLLAHAPSVLTCLSTSNVFRLFNTLLKKLAVKLVQRLGLVFLKAKVPAWRYQRGQRSLAENLAPELVDQLKTSENGHAQQVSDDDEYDIPQEIEDILDHLLFGLKDPDTIVRWSAAKGIGRITGRLPKELADEIITSVLECFSLQESEGSWHGGCLALAELGRRGLLLLHRLGEVVPVVLRALTYDERRGSFNVGAAVRDAACYVCWSFARAYDPKEIKPYVNQIASSMIITAVFDREVNCRRAASAAFQENVGRQGTFPHGVDILTAADYFAVGNRNNVYLNVSVYIAQFHEYTRPLIDHLVDIKLRHWDSAIRVLAAQALHNLTVRDPEYMASVVIPKLLVEAVGIDRNARHGSLIAIGEITHALSIHTSNKDNHFQCVVSEDYLSQMKSIVNKMVDAKLFRGIEGEMMRFAVCQYIQKLSLARVPFHDDPVIGVWQAVLDDNIPHIDHDDPWIQKAAVDAFEVFSVEFYSSDDCRAVAGDVVDRYIEKLQSSIDFERMGFALALGAMPKCMLVGKLDKVVYGLIEATKSLTNKDQNALFTEARRDALKGLTSICSTVGLSVSDPGCLHRDHVTAIFGSMLSALENYTMDSRGDVGAWVREASMSGIATLIELTVQSVPDWFTADLCRQIVCCFVQQINEKIDRTRAHAGSIFLKLLHSTSPVVPHVPHRKELEMLFAVCDQDALNWAAPSESFPKSVQLLSLPTYQYSALLGLIVSVGGLTESLVNHSSSSFLQYLKQISSSVHEMHQFMETLLSIFTNHHKDDRVTIPFFKTVDLLFSSSALNILLTDSQDTFSLRLFNLCKDEIAGSGDAKKIIASISVFCGLIAFSGAVRRKTIERLLIFLCHKYPRVRTATADQLYVALLTFDDAIPDGCHDDVMTMLSETLWNSSVETVRPIRNNLCDIFGIPKPKAKRIVSTVKASSNSNDEMGYKDLVDRVGY